MQIEMVTRACPVCGSDDESRVFAEADFDAARWDRFAFASRKLPEYMHYRLIACTHCDLLYANPLPTLQTLASAYEEADFDSSEEAHYASLTYAEILHPLLPRLPDRDGVLDIGTGDGAFLEQLVAKGFTRIVGVEPSTAPIAAAKAAIRPLIRHGLFRPEEFQRERFSLITCFQTIEHLYDPLRMCHDAYALLKEGGAIFLIGHNHRALSARILGMKSPVFDIEHLQLFSPRSARTLLEQAGFRDVELKRVVNRYPLHYLLKLFPMAASVKLRLVALLGKAAIGSVPAALPLGNIAAIGYKRQN